MPRSFWAYVRALGQHLGYTKDGALLEPTPDEIRAALRELKLGLSPLKRKIRKETLLSHLTTYFTYRARILGRYVEPRLMNRSTAHKEFFVLKETAPAVLSLAQK